MMNESGLRRVPPDQSSGSGHTFGTPRHPGIADPILSKRVCFYKSGDPQFNGLRMVINHRTFKTFDALLDSLSKKVPLPFGVRNITTPRGFHAIYTLDELEDGKSYICSDSRKVKPINLAVARKKLPPWYHARPASARRRTVQQARFFPGRSIHKQEPVVVRTPKRLLVFRNGEPSVRYSVVLHKRNTPTFESVLEYVSEVMQMDVVKLHTLDGRRVDGLPGLILCSGAVVAAGREPFRPANYNAQKSAAATRLPTNRAGPRRLKAMNYKKKSLSNLSKARNFSSSSERYIVNRIRNSIAESPRNMSTNPTISDELNSAQKLESVEETEADARLSDGAEGLGCLLPTDDDIEKSFRVNQDGSMTVEMRVRLTIKEEETIQWTTTLKRSSAADQLTDTCVPEHELQSSSPKPNALDLQTPPASVDTTNKDKTKDNNDEDPPSLSNGVFSDSSNEEHHVKVQTDAESPRRAPTPGHKQVRKKQTSLDSINSATAGGLQQGVVGSYSYTEQTDHGAVTEKYCLLQQSSTRPVPKPRRLGSLDANTTNSRSVSTFKSAEILQIESSGEEITETLLHIYEQQTCQDSFLANICSQDMSGGLPLDRPGTSETGRASLKNRFQPENRRPLTASESISRWRAESCSSDLTLSSLQTGAIQATNRQLLPQKGDDKPKQKGGSKDKMVSLKPKGVNKRSGRVTSPGKRQKEKRTKVKAFSSAGFIRRIYGNKSGKSTRKHKKRPTQRVGGGLETKNSSGDCKGPNIPLQENTSPIENGGLNVSCTKANHSKEILTRQISVHQEKLQSLSGFTSFSSVTNEYVQKWLEKSNLGSTAHVEEGKTHDAVSHKQLEHRHNGEFVTGAEHVKHLGEKSDRTCPTLQPHPTSESLQETSVKLRVQSFESKSSQVTEKSTTPQQSVYSYPEIKHSTNEIPLQKETLCSVFPLELPPPPPDENTEYCREDRSLAHSSSLYKHSPVNTTSPDNEMEMASVQTDIPSAPLPRTQSIKRAPLVSNLSLERKMSMRKACLDKYAACSEDTSETSTSSSLINTPIHNVLPKGNGPTVTQASETVQEETRKSIMCGTNSPSCCTSESPTSLTSDDRISSTSVSSPETLTQNNILCKDTEAETPQSDPKEASTPEATVKKVKIISSPSIMKKSQTKTDLRDASPKLSSLHNRPSQTTTSPSTVRHVTVNASPSTTKKQVHKPKLQKRRSPYSQSLDMVSPPVRNKSFRTMMSRNLSSDNAPEAERKTPSWKKHNPTPKSKTTAGLDKTATCENEANQTGNLNNAATETTPIHPEHPADMKPVLDKICYSIKSIRQITQNKRPSCLEKSNSLPDFSSHVASTFGSSSKVLLAFLSVMTLKDCLTNFNMDELHANNVSCAEALKMIDSLREIANIEDSQKLKCSLSDLQQSASKHLLQSWKGFQEIGDKCKSRSTTPVFLEHGFLTEASLEKDCSTEENVINELMDNLDLPERLKEELVSFSVGVNSESDVEETMSAMIIKKLSLNEDSDGQTYSSPTAKDPAPMMDDAPEETANVDVRSIIRTFVEVNQPKGTNLVRCSLKPQPREETTKDEDHQNIPAKCQAEKPNDKETLRERQLFNTELCRKEVQKLCGDGVNKESQDQGHTEDRSNNKRSANGEEQSCASEGSKQDIEYEKLQKQSEEIKSMSENKLTSSDESSSEEERQIMPSINRDVEENERCREGSSGSEAGEQQCLQEPGSEWEKIKEESSEGDSSNEENNSEEEEANKQPSSNYYAELNLKRGKTTSNPEAKVWSKPQSPFNLEKEQEIQRSCMGLDVSVDGSTTNSDVDEPCVVEEEQQSVKHPEPGPKFTNGESLSDLEEELESVEVEEHLDDLSSDKDELKTNQISQGLVKNLEHDKASKGDKTQSQNVVDRDLSIVIENQDLGSKKEIISLIESDSLTKHYFNADEDSGNDHSSLEEQAEEEPPKMKCKQMSSSIEEELSYYEKESSSEEEHANTHRSVEECYEDTPEMATESDNGAKHDRAADQFDNIISQSVAERVSLLEKQVAEAQSRRTIKETSTRNVLQTNAQVETDVDDSSSESPTSQPALCTRSAPQSSLAFSYDSCGVITTEPEGHRVRSIREMFLAKSAMDLQQGNRRFPSPNSSELSELRAQTSVSGGYQSQTSSDVSSGEDDSARKSITKGFVRRTIERLYGKKNQNPEEEEGERSLAEPEQKKKEHSSIFSPFHSARSKAMSELSYFSSTNALDTLNEATRCITFNAQVGPGDSLPIDRWLLRENTLIRKSVSDPVGIHKTFTSSGQREEMCEDTAENSPYSLFSTKSEQEVEKSLSRKCTYFSLPHGSDSEACQDDQSVVSRSSGNGDNTVDTTDNPEDAKTGAERNTVLTAISDFKLTDNKVHPLVELPLDGEVVLVQPRKGQGAVNRRLQEPDMLDLLYNFCGQHCPVL